MCVWQGEGRWPLWLCVHGEAKAGGSCGYVCVVRRRPVAAVVMCV